MTGAELVALIAVIGTTIGGILTTLFHSRCSKIICCWGCLNCDREVMNSENEELNPQNQN
jgi:hypothetical protein